MSERSTRRARRAAAASARRLHRLERTRRRGPFAAGGTVMLVLAGGVVAVAAVAAMTGRVEVPAPPGVTAAFAHSASVETAADDLVVRIANGSGEDTMTAEVARLARLAGIHGYETVAGAPRAADTRIQVHRDVPAVLAAAADLRDLIGVGVVERADAAGHDADLTVVVGTDVRGPA